jgi:hypothetical protein
MTDSLDVDVSSEIRKEAQVGELVCHRANAKDRDERNMDMDMDMDIGVAGSPYSRNYGALTKRVAEY